MSKNFPVDKIKKTKIRGWCKRLQKNTKIGRKNNHIRNSDVRNLKLI